MNARILVAYGSRHGSTAEIAERIGEVLTRRGADVTVVSAEQAGPPDSYDAVVAGSGVYIGHWLEPARDFVREHTRPH